MAADDGAAGKSGIEVLSETLKRQVDSGDVVNQSGTLLALGSACEDAGQLKPAVRHFVDCLVILSKTDQLAKVRMRTVLDTPQEFTVPIAREAAGRLLGLLTSRTGWPLAEQAFRTLEQHLLGADIRRYLRTYLLGELESLNASELDDAGCEWLRWAIEMLSVIDPEVALPSGVNQEDLKDVGSIADVMASHLLEVGRPIWERLLAPLGRVDVARPRLVLDLAARWEADTSPDRPLLPWFTALWLGRGDSALEERLDRLETLAHHPNNPGAQEAAAHSLGVLSGEHAPSVLVRLTRLAAHPYELVRANAARSLVETAHRCRRESLALLRQLRRDDSPRVREMAARSLRAIRGPFWRLLP
jgi:hypothetical protein